MRTRLRRALVFGGLVLAGGSAIAQTTQGLISGRLIHSQSGGPVAGGQVSYWATATGATGEARSDAKGNYFLPLLSPGMYRIRAAADGFQPREVQELELAVAGRLELNFTLRPLSDVWESGQYRSVLLPGTKTIVTFYGPDVDTSRAGSFEATKGRRGVLESTLSQVIDPRQVRDLPLAGRDVYTMLVTQPNVTADTGTARGLGLSVTGARPASSNYLLDGLENNNYQVTGPLSVIAPEAIQEYRVSTNNFSAEYGRSSGFVANAVTRAGGAQFHGVGYLYLKNDALNANGFQQNARGFRRAPVRERQLGFQAGGPAIRNRLYFSTAFEDFRSRSRQDASEFLLPTPEFVKFFDFGKRSSIALLKKYPSPAPGDGRNITQFLTLEPPVSVDRKLSLTRLDYSSPKGADKAMLRAAVGKVGRPDFLWSPYPDFVSALAQDTLGLGLTWTRALRPGLTNEARAGWSRDDLGWDRAHPEVPTLFPYDGATLPGSLGFYGFRNDSRTWELVDSLVWARGHHVVTAGVGVLRRSLSGELTAGKDGAFFYDGVTTFGLDQPESYYASVDRQSTSTLQPPDYFRVYHYNQYSFFAQDTFRATSRLALNYGLRYDRFGAPRNTGSVKDMTVQLGRGANLAEQIDNSKIVPGQPGEQQIYSSDKNDLAGRFGFSYDLTGSAKTLLRGAYGIFYDRPFDTFWQNVRNNNWVWPGFSLAGRRQVDITLPVATLLKQFGADPSTGVGVGELSLFDFPGATYFDGNLRSAYAQTYFYGLQRQVTENWVLELNGSGSLGRKLLVSDLANRFNRAPGGLISHRSSMGKSNYQALSAVARYRASRGSLQVAYTWGHAIDHQSDALAGNFFDLSIASLAVSGRSKNASLARQGDLRADRGSADFDQRHNLVFYSLWDLPSLWSGHKAGLLFRNWKFAQLAAFRTGFPFSVFAASASDGETVNLADNRANIQNPAAAFLPTPKAVLGGVQLLDPAAFRQPTPAYLLGNSGRNAFRGPGIYNLDLSLSRSFGLKWFGEAGRVTVRADAFNFLNHANLNNPDSLITSDTFGIAGYGRAGRGAGFPAVSPLNETARQVQMLLRVEF